MEYRGMSLQRGWLPVVAAVVVSLGVVAVIRGQTAEPMLRLIAFGDNEGVMARPVDDLTQKNPALPRLMEDLAGRGSENADRFCLAHR